MKKSFKDLLEELEYEKLEESGKLNDDEDVDTDDSEDDDDDEEKDEPSPKELPDMKKGHYTADDLKELITYVQDLIRKEHEEDEDSNDEDSDKKHDDFGDVGLDLISELRHFLFLLRIFALFLR